MKDPLSRDPQRKHALLNQLMRMARRADVGIRLVSDQHGHSAFIERDPAAPGAMKLTFDGFEPPKIDAQWVIPAGDRAPAFYPEHVPFLAGFPCRMMHGGGHFMALWRDDACPLAELANGAEGSTDSDGMSGTTWLSDARARAGTHHSVEDAAEWMGSRSAEAELHPRYLGAFTHLAEATLADGWIEVRRKAPVSFSARSLVAERGDRRRLITLSGAMGQNTLSLTEGPPSALL